MRSLHTYVWVSHGVDNNVLWLVQGDGANEWFVAHDWQKKRLNAFYNTCPEPIGFIKHGYEYRIQSVLIQSEMGHREIVFKNLTTGVVRLVQRCTMEGPVYSHKGCSLDGITILRKNPDTNEIDRQTISV